MGSWIKASSEGEEARSQCLWGGASHTVFPVICGRLWLEVVAARLSPTPTPAETDRRCSARA